MKIDDIIEGSVTGHCKKSGKPIIDGNCVCPGEQKEHKCKCQGQMDLRKIIPFIALNARYYKGLN